MKQKTLEALAKQDAHDWGLAQMFFGEGAGTRRKLVAARIDQRVLDIPGYEQALDKAYAKLNQIEMAEEALELRKKIDRANKAGKNIRAIKSGNLHAVSNGVYLILGGAYLAHATGYDKKIQAEAKKLWKKAKTEVKFRKARMQGRNVEKIGGN